MSFPVNKERHGCITSKQEVAILIYKFLKDEGYSSTIDSFRRECVYVKKPPKLSELAKVKSLSSILNEYLFLKQRETRRNDFATTFGEDSQAKSKLQSVFSALDDYMRYRQYVENKGRAPPFANNEIQPMANLRVEELDDPNLDFRPTHHFPQDAVHAQSDQADHANQSFALPNASTPLNNTQGHINVSADGSELDGDGDGEDDSDNGGDDDGQESDFGGMQLFHENSQDLALRPWNKPGPTNALVNLIKNSDKIADRINMELEESQPGQEKEKMVGDIVEKFLQDPNLFLQLVSGPSSRQSPLAGIFSLAPHPPDRFCTRRPEPTGASRVASRRAVGSAPSSPIRKSPTGRPHTKKRARAQVTAPTDNLQDKSDHGASRSPQMPVSTPPSNDVGANALNPQATPSLELPNGARSPLDTTETSTKKQKTIDDVLPDEFNIDGFLDSLNYASNG